METTSKLQEITNILQNYREKIEHWFHCERNGVEIIFRHHFIPQDLKDLIGETEIVYDTPQIKTNQWMNCSWNDEGECEVVNFERVIHFKKYDFFLGITGDLDNWGNPDLVRPYQFFEMKPKQITIYERA